MKKTKKEPNNSSQNQVTLPPDPPGPPPKPAQEKWKHNRHHSHHKEYESTDEASAMIGITFNYVFPSLENNNVAQASTLGANEGSTGEIPQGDVVKFPDVSTSSFIVDLALKPNRVWTSWTWGMDFYYFLNKKKDSSAPTTETSQVNSTYQTTFNTFVQDIKHIKADLSTKLQMLGMYMVKPIFSQDYAFFTIGFGARYMNLKDTRSIDYTTDSQVACIEASQDVKGIGIYFTETLGVFFTNRVGLELQFENGIMYNKFQICHNTKSITSAETLYHANTDNSTHDYNKTQRISVYLAFHDYAFTEKHIEFKIGLDYLTLETDKISKQIDTSYSDTKSLHLPAVSGCMAVYF